MVPNVILFLKKKALCLSTFDFSFCFCTRHCVVPRLCTVLSNHVAGPNMCRYNKSNTTNTYIHCMLHHEKLAQQADSESIGCTIDIKYLLIENVRLLTYCVAHSYIYEYMGIDENKKYGHCHITCNCDKGECYCSSITEVRQVER